VTRELVRAEGFPGGFAALYPAFTALETLGAARRGYFVEGLGGAQFALPGAVERLREAEGGEGAVVLAATDPAQLYGAALRWPQAVERPPARRAGASVVQVAGRPVVFVEAGGRGLQVLAGSSPTDVEAALAALVEAVAAGRLVRLAFARIDGGPALESPYRDRLVELGFRAGLRSLTLARDGR
jgi:ATP-dependent Lhr-like helicase